ncbi:MAG: dihydroorotase family protein [Trueperaceae bacterium]|nr:MAG: dihydroorotase family protein [Trueperaceae bacterium]
MSYDLVINGGTLVLPNGLVEADLGIESGRIAALGEGLRGTQTVDTKNLLVLPGLVDPHVHPIHAETYRSVSEAAIHGGITTTLHHLYTPPDRDPVRFFEQAIPEAEADSYTDFAFHVRLNDLARTQPAIAELTGRGSPTFKLFLAYGGRGIMVTDDEILLAMQAAVGCGGTLLFHAENGPLTELLEVQARDRGSDSLLDYYASRPAEVEIEAVARLLSMVKLTRCPTYFVHLTCRESVRLVAAAKLEGLPVYAETCPHYLLLSAVEAAGLGGRAKMAPPLREDADRQGLWYALAAGFIDAIGSDHSAFVPAEKEGLDSIFEVGFGVPGIATMFPLLFDRGVRQAKVTLARLVDAMATRPAQILGLSGRKGCLAVGYDADFFLFDPEKPFVIDDASERGNAYYSLYAGRRGKGSIESVYCRGVPALLAGELQADAAKGRFVRREIATGSGGASTGGSRVP